MKQTKYFLSSILQYNYKFLHFQTWYGKTPLGKKRAKALAGDDDDAGKKGKGKKGGKKK